MKTTNKTTKWGDADNINYPGGITNEETDLEVIQFLNDGTVYINKIKKEQIQKNLNIINLTQSEFDDFEKYTNSINSKIVIKIAEKK